MQVLNHIIYEKKTDRATRQEWKEIYLNHANASADLVDNKMMQRNAGDFVFVNTLAMRQQIGLRSIPPDQNN